MKRLWRWIKSKFVRESLRTQRLDVLEARRDASRRQIAKRERTIIGMRRAVEVLFVDVQQELEDAKHIERQYDAEIDRLRAELQVCEDVTIPLLAAANKLALERYDADTAIEVRRRVHYAGRIEE